MLEGKQKCSEYSYTLVFARFTKNQNHGALHSLAFASFVQEHIYAWHSVLLILQVLCKYKAVLGFFQMLLQGYFKSQNCTWYRFALARFGPKLNCTSRNFAFAFAFARL